MNVCLDACFLIGLYDERDQHHERSQELFAEIFDATARNTAVIVWPALYETVSTQLVRHRGRMALMERDWRRMLAARGLVFLEDGPYREEAFELCLREVDKPAVSYRPLSLTDRVLRSVLADSNARVDAIITFNIGDFADICRKTNREIVS
jgi:predicted nucleic acid-binding protein